MATKYFNTSLRNLTYRLRKFKDILDEELKEEILNHWYIILDMVSEDQLYEQGINGRGVEIKSYMPYAQRTIRNKIKKGQPINRVTLRDTGELRDSLRLESDGEGFYITSTDDKAPYLLKKYGKTIFRLTDENLKVLLDKYIRPELQAKLKEYIEYG